MVQRLALSNGAASTLVDDGDYAFLSQWRWKRNNKGYAVRSEMVNDQRVVLCMHRVILQAQRGQYVDHRDGDKLNNTRANLRLCSQSQNQANRHRHKNNTSGYKGVTRRGARWHARIWVRGQQIHLGYHDRADDASLVYDHAARRFFGEFARLNHPDLPPMTFYERLLDDILAGRQPQHALIRLQKPAASRRFSP